MRPTLINSVRRYFKDSFGFCSMGQKCKINDNNENTKYNTDNYFLLSTTEK